MKRDLDLARQILQWIDDQPDGHNVSNWNIDIAGATKDEIGYHVSLLGQAGLLNVVDTTTLDARAPTAVALSMTWAGHDFLSATKPHGLWARARKEVIGPAGGVAFTVLLEWLKAEGKKMAGLPP